MTDLASLPFFTPKREQLSMNREKRNRQKDRERKQLKKSVTFREQRCTI